MDAQTRLEAATDVLHMLGRPAVILDGVNVMLSATAEAEVFGLQAGRPLIELELLNLVDWARKAGSAETFEGALNLGTRTAKTWVLATAAPIGDGLIALTIEDRTEARRLDETRRDFVANISHELKTPIGAIGLLAETLQGATDDPDAVKRFAASLQREASRLGQIVQDIIELSRLQSASIVEHNDEVEMLNVVTESIERTRVFAEVRRTKVVANLAPGCVLGNEEQLTAAVTNLLENAINYSDQNSQVGVAINSHDGVVEVVVTDSGVGIAIDDQARIFERFYRVDPSRSRETGGTGLGLAIVKHIAQNHGGDISVFSKPGLGSTFTLTLPECTRSHE
ncbi:MAG: sensor histidine kinase [Micrococcales bacterium]